jgi:hypothetical protein
MHEVYGTRLTNLCLLTRFRTTATATTGSNASGLPSPRSGVEHPPHHHRRSRRARQRAHGRSSSSRNSSPASERPFCAHSSPFSAHRASACQCECLKSPAARMSVPPHRGAGFSLPRPHSCGRSARQSLGGKSGRVTRPPAPGSVRLPASPAETRIQPLRRRTR